MKCYFCKTESTVERDEWNEWICPECRTANGSEEDILTSEQLNDLADNVGCPFCDNEEEMVKRVRDKIVENPQNGNWPVECPTCDYKAVIEENGIFEDGYYWRQFSIRC